MSRHGAGCNGERLGFRSFPSNFTPSFRTRAAIDGRQRETVAGDEWLRGIHEEVEDVTLSRAQEQTVAIGEQPQFPGVVQRLGKAPAKVVAQRVHHLPQGGRREPAPAQGGQRDQLEDIDWCVSTFREPAGHRPPRRDRWQKNTGGIPALQLPGRQPGQPGDFTSAIARLETH